jgi:hypothetical protein
VASLNLNTYSEPNLTLNGDRMKTMYNLLKALGEGDIRKENSV